LYGKCSRKKNKIKEKEIKERRTNMSKIVWAVAIILMIMAPVVMAEDSKPGAVAEKGSPKAVKSFAVGPAGGDASSAVLGTQMAWGRYGPISLGPSNTAYWRIYYGGSFSSSPTVGDMLNVRYPADIWTVYSLGADAGYTYVSSFDARLRTYYGSVGYPSYIDWQAFR
jgi:hypothetical protein